MKLLPFSSESSGAAASVSAETTEALEGPGSFLPLAEDRAPKGLNFANDAVVDRGAEVPGRTGPVLAPPPVGPTRFNGSLRLLNIHVRVPMLLLALVEAALVYTCIATACVIVHANETWAGAFARAENIALAITLWLALAAMGLYRSGQRDGAAGLLVRMALGALILAPLGMLLLSVVLPDQWVDARVTLIAVLLTLPAIFLLRQVGLRAFNENLFRPRVLVIGTGNEAKRLLQRMRRRSDRQGFELVGFLAFGSRNVLGDGVIAPLLRLDDDEELFALCRRHDIDEIVLAWDDRRGNNVSQRMPLSALLNCKMSGIAVTELTTFFEREAGRIDVDILRASWLLFSPGFHQPLRQGMKRLFDLIASIGLLAVTWPFMLLIALAIKLEDGWRAPVFYRQCRSGLNGREYEVLKFRSMRVDAERCGEAVWAEKDDPRITRVGRVLRAARLDELPQLFNVLAGDMAFVGPRPERPVFVAQLAEDIPFYADRHRVKPGLTGWAQINYPYGASTEDARRKLEYDLYYAKNYCLLLDLIILIRTVEVVLVGKGAR